MSSLMIHEHVQTTLAKARKASVFADRVRSIPPLILHNSYEADGHHGEEQHRSRPGEGPILPLRMSLFCFANRLIDSSRISTMFRGCQIIMLGHRPLLTTSLYRRMRIRPCSLILPPIRTRTYRPRQNFSMSLLLDTQNGCRGSPESLGSIIVTTMQRPWLWSSSSMVHETCTLHTWPEY